MRAGMVVFVLMVLLAPLAGAWVLPARVAPEPVFEISDAELLFRLAEHKGLHPSRVAAPEVPAGLLLSTMVQRIGVRAGVLVEPADARAFDALDPALQAPVLQLLVAMDAAWTMRDAAFADVSEEELRAAHDAVRAKGPTPAILTPEDEELLVNAAIMLTDTLESVVLPQLVLLADAPVWPAVAVADPVGVLRIGGTGNDIETLHRVLQIDARGADTYRNNAGGTTILEAGLLQTPVSISVDLSGNDHYWNRGTNPTPAQGGAFAGIGLLVDRDGDDLFECRSGCQGGSSHGVGMLRDLKGRDTYRYPALGLGASNVLIGVFRDDNGDDFYRTGSDAGGFGSNGGIGLMWDRAGTDEFWTSSFLDVWGYGLDDGEGWFVNEGPAVESYRDADTGLAHPVACNDCMWTQGSLSRGHGNDNAGGLATLLARQR